MLPSSEPKPGRIGKVRKVPLTEFDEESELSLVPLASPPAQKFTETRASFVTIRMGDDTAGNCGSASARALVELDRALARYDAAISSLIKFSETL